MPWCAAHPSAASWLQVATKAPPNRLPSRYRPDGVWASRKPLVAGTIMKANIITPTSQNIANLEVDMRVLAQSLADAGASLDDIRLEVEKLVRAYDPCLSCSVH